MARRLSELRNGAVIPSSKMSGTFVARLCEEGALQKIRQGRTKAIYRVANTLLFDLMLARMGINNLEQYISIMEAEEVSRAALVSVARDSKLFRIRSFKGFLVNCYESIEAILNGQPYLLSPTDGTFIFIYDFETFTIPSDVVVIGVENPENFRRIRQQRHLFEGMKVLFLSRYPQSQHSDVRQWLSAITNRYIHFGDIDPAGISIFINEYYAYLGEKTSFFIPEKVDCLLAKYGLRERYDKQVFNFDKAKLETMPELKMLCELILEMELGMDQEGLISTL